MTDPLSDLFWKDEILQIVFWYLGEQLGPTVSAADLRPFLDADPPLVQTHLARLTAEGYLTDEGQGCYTLTDLGRREGGRRFADEFDGLTKQAHGECNDPNCACKTQGPEACETHQHQHEHVH